MNQAPALRSASHIKGEIEVEWCDGRVERFHCLWLRDNCSRGRGYVKGLEHRVHRLIELPEEPQPQAVRCRPDRLEIDWQGGHSSVYPSAWLDRFAPARANPLNRPAAEPWDRAGLGAVPTWALSALDGDGVFGMLDTLLRKGLVRVRQTPAEAGYLPTFFAGLSTLVETIFGSTWALVPRPQDDALTHWMEHSLFPLHTDLTFFQSTNAFMAFHCVSFDDRGGESIFADGFLIAEDLRRSSPEHFDILSTIDTAYRYLDDTMDSRARQRIIETDYAGKVTGIAFNDRQMLPLDLPHDLIMPYYRAYRDWASRAHDPRYAVELKLEPGDLLIFDNRRLLHGRQAISKTGWAARHIEGCYLEPAGFEIRWRRLLRERTVGAELPRDPWPSVVSPVPWSSAGAQRRATMPGGERAG